MDFDSNRRGSIKSKMLQSFLSNSPMSSTTRSSTTKCSYKSSKKVVTSSGSKVAVFEAESQSFMASETVGDETKTESSHAEAERYCELENEDTEDDFSKDLKSVMNTEFGAIMDRPFGSLMPDSDEEAEDEGAGDDPFDSGVAGSDVECKFGICPKGKPCACLDDCDIDDRECSSLQETELVCTLKETKLD